MLTIPTPHREAAVPHRWDRLRRADWDRLVVLTVAAFHLLASSALAFAPDSQIVNAGTEPAFAFIPREAWAVVFLAAGIAALALAHRASVARQLCTWFIVVPIAFAWTGSLIIALLDGGGSAIAAAGWATLLVLWGISAVRIALHTD